MPDSQIIQKLKNCKNCIFSTKCSDYRPDDPLAYCNDFKHKNKCINLKVLPGDDVWITKPDIFGEELSKRTITHISFHGNKTIYHTEDFCFEESAFGDYVFRTSTAAKLIRGIQGGVIND